MDAPSDLRTRLNSVLLSLAGDGAARELLRDDDDLAERLDLNSMDFVGVAIEIEREFGFAFGADPADTGALRTFGELLRLVAQRVPSG